MFFCIFLSLSFFFKQKNSTQENRPVDLAPVFCVCRLCGSKGGRAAPGPGKRRLTCLWDTQNLLSARHPHPSTNWEQIPRHSGSIPDRQKLPRAIQPHSRPSPSHIRHLPGRDPWNAFHAVHGRALPSEKQRQGFGLSWLQFMSCQ